MVDDVVPSNQVKSHVSHEDCRREPRIAVRTPIRLTVLSAPNIPAIEGRCYDCWTDDLSWRGVRFRVHTRVPLAAILKMDIELLDRGDGSFLHMGRVAWEQEFEEDGLISRWLGVEITETIGDEDCIRRWRQLIGDLQCVAALADV
ncbi:MAG: PilZ domain-containing protein [Kiritimatiellia bacterium]